MIDLKILCETKDSLPLDKLTPLQGDLKNLSDENFKKMREQLLSNGFAFPFFVWRNVENKKTVNYILDGHQRDRTLKEMARKGDAKMPAKFPVVYVNAENRTKAAKLLLAASSQFGEMTEESLYKFIGENELLIPELKMQINFDAINFDRFADGWGAEGGGEQAGPTDGDAAKTFEIIVECASETEQQELYEQLTASGKKCRILAL